MVKVLLPLYFRTREVLPRAWVMQVLLESGAVSAALVRDPWCTASPAPMLTLVAGRREGHSASQVWFLL